MIEKLIGLGAATAVWTVALATAPAMFAAVALGVIVTAPAMRAHHEMLAAEAERVEREGVAP